MTCAFLDREHIPVTVAAANLGISWETLPTGSIPPLTVARVEWRWIAVWSPPIGGHHAAPTLLVTDVEALAAMVDTCVSDIIRTAEAALLDRLLIDNA